MAEEDQMVVVRCVDLARFEVPASLAQRTGSVAAAMEAGERVVELPRGVSGKGLATAMAYYEARAEAEAYGVDGDEFDGEFIRGLTHDEAIDLIHAAHHLGDDALFNLFLGYRSNFSRRKLQKKKTSEDA